MPHVRLGQLELFHETDGAGEPVLLLMGLGGDHHAWGAVRRELARPTAPCPPTNPAPGATTKARASSGPPTMPAAPPGGMDPPGINPLPVVGHSRVGRTAR